MEESINTVVTEEIVRVLMVGDPQCGKTSLIHVLVNEEFVPTLPARLTDIIIPAKVNFESTSLHILDYSAKEQPLDELQKYIKKADVICVIYDISARGSFDRVIKHWIPYISDCLDSNLLKPIIIVANKIDIAEKDSIVDVNSKLEERKIEYVAHFEVSALNQKSVIELFSAAQRCVIYPSNPLFDAQLKILTKKCRNALEEIFKLCDQDGDGLLNDHELNLFQENCFGTPLQKDFLEDLKVIISQSAPEGLVDHSMSLVGFLFLHTLYADRGRFDFTWKVLRKFGYDNQLTKINKISQSSTESKIRLYEGRKTPTGIVETCPKSNANKPDRVARIFNLAWMRRYADAIRLGVGVTVASMLSVYVIKCLRNGSRFR